MQKAYNMGKENNYFESFIATVVSLSAILVQKKKYHEAIENLEYGIKMAKMIKRRMDESSLLFSLGNVYFEMEDYDKAIETLNKSIELSDKMYVTINSALYLADIFFKKKDFDATFGCLNTFLEFAEKYNYKSGQAQILESMGKKYSELGYYKEGINELKKGLKIIRELKETYYEAIILFELGKIYQDIEENNKAVENFRIALKIFEEFDDKPAQFRVLEHYARVYYDKGNYLRSISLLKTSLAIAKEMQNGQFYKDTGDIIVFKQLLRLKSKALPVVIVLALLIFIIWIRLFY